MPELILLSDGRPVLRCPLHGQSLTVGSSPVNDISLPDEDTPALLCAIHAEDGAYHVASRDGAPLLVNGEPGDAHRLRDGDEIALGRLVGRFVAETAADRIARKERPQRTGILTRADDGTLKRTDLALELPASLGGKRLTLPDTGLRVGAHEDNDIVIDDGFVSSFHAQIYLRGEAMFVRDLDSTNGTFINDIRVIEAEIPRGAPLRVGKTTLKMIEQTSPERLDGPGDGPWRCDELVTADKAFAGMFALIEKVAAHDATVAVFGETGSGKELVARAVHNLSGRVDKPFVPLNCAAIPANLIESLLFGHERGAFTGADRQHQGVFEEAHGGTLFLDEVGELPLDLQAKLLRVLETRLVRRVGGRQDIPVDVRIVCATHRDLVEHVSNGRFREDLLHRLYVIPVHIPPLRERPDDIAHLAAHFVDLLAPDTAALTDAARHKLLEHPYPGNVRELRNVIQRALILRDGPEVDAAAIQFLPVRAEDAQQMGRIYRKGMSLEDVERQAFAEALAAYGTAAEAARALGVPKTTFWRRATALGVLKKDK
jgi:DNA-binding NtrC family response regulator